MRGAILLAMLLGACTGIVTSPGGSPTPSGDDTGTAVDATPMATPGAGAVARGAMWVASMVPYCQSPNHVHDGDSDCAATCTRPDNPDWDAYRSDCSGFVSWSWDLPAPGRTTAGFAPFQTDLTHTIDVTDLRPGDAINNDTHTMLFVSWVTVGETATFYEEPGCASSEPYARETQVTITATDGVSLTLGGYGEFSAIRYDSAP